MAHVEDLVLLLDSDESLELSLKQGLRQAISNAMGGVVMLRLFRIQSENLLTPLLPLQRNIIGGLNANIE